MHIALVCLESNSIDPILKSDCSIAALRGPAPFVNKLLYPAPRTTEHNMNKATLRTNFTLAAKQWYIGYLASSSVCLKTVCWYFPVLTLKLQLIIWKQDAFLKNIFFSFFFQIFKKYLLKLVNGIIVEVFRLILTSLFDQFFLSLVKKDYSWTIFPLASNLCRRSCAK